MRKHVWRAANPIRALSEGTDLCPSGGLLAPEAALQPLPDGQVTQQVTFLVTPLVGGRVLPAARALILTLESEREMPQR